MGETPWCPSKTDSVLFNNHAWLESVNDIAAEDRFYTSLTHDRMFTEDNKLYYRWMSFYLHEYSLNKLWWYDDGNIVKRV